MSYEIIYNRAFIKVDDNKVICVLKMGSNNCYEPTYNSNKMRRARSWSNDCFVSNYKDGFVKTTEEITNKIDEFRQERIERANENVKQYGDSWAYDDKSWGYHTAITLYGKSTKGTSFAMFKNYYLNGIKTAKTIEEYKALGITFNIHVYCFNRKEEFEDKGIEYKEHVYFETTEQMLAAINEFSDYYNQHNKAFYIGCNLTDYSEKRLKEKRVKKPTEIKHLKEVWTLISVENNGYFIKQLKYGYQYCYSINSAKKFLNEKAANTFHKKMKNKEKFNVVKSSGEFTLIM